jgi:hypothetical protein
VTDFTAFYVNVDGPFSVTPPIHTHYYTPRDHNDWRNISTPRPQRPYIYDDMGLTLPFSPFSPLSGTNHATSNTLRRRRLRQTTKHLETYTSRLTVDIFYFLYCHAARHVEEIDLSHAAMTRSYLLAGLLFRCRRPFRTPRIDVAHIHSMNRVLSWIGLTEIYMDDSQLNSTGIDDDDFYISTSNRINLLNLFRRCVTVWNIWAFKISHGPMALSWLGHCHRTCHQKGSTYPSLRWLSSNHSEENITMLRAMRTTRNYLCDESCCKHLPEITFVSDKLCWEHTFQVGYNWQLCIFCS